LTALRAERWRPFTPTRKLAGDPDSRTQRLVPGISKAETFGY
jgi:hypothetical protein